MSENELCYAMLNKLCYVVRCGVVRSSVWSAVPNTPSSSSDQSSQCATPSTTCNVHDTGPHRVGKLQGESHDGLGQEARGVVGQPQLFPELAQCCDSECISVGVLLNSVEGGMDHQLLSAE